MGSRYLIQLAEAFHRPVHSCDIRDANVGEPICQELCIKRRGFRVSVGVSASRVKCAVQGLDASVFFSVNLPDRVLCLNQPLERSIRGLTLPVFVGEHESETVAAWLQMSTHAALVAAFDLQADESLHVYRNGISLVGRPSRASLQTVEQLCDLAEVLRVDPGAESIVDLPFDLERVPADLRALEPLVRRFAVGDDDVRADLLAEASSEVRAQLSQQVTPLLSHIDAYLDTFAEGPLPSEAILLGRLAEVTCEVNRSDA